MNVYVNMHVHVFTCTINIIILCIMIPICYMYLHIRSFTSVSSNCGHKKPIAATVPASEVPSINTLQPHMVC